MRAKFSPSSHFPFSSRHRSIAISRVFSSSRIKLAFSSFGKMKPGESSLNPYAAAYVPLFKQGVADQNTDFNAVQASQTRNGNVWRGHQPANTWTQGQNQNVYQNHGHSGAAYQAPGASRWRDSYANQFDASSSQYVPNMSGKSNTSDDMDMDMAYLQMTFPGISEESLSDVYTANDYDLDAAVDMLNQLELHPDDSFDKLPDTLDIGDVPGSPTVLTSPTLKNVTTQAASSSAKK